MGGGDVLSRLIAKKPDRATAKIILAESVVAVETVHSAGIKIEDLHYGNFLIDNEGHIVISDFGFSTPLKDDKDSFLDWNMLYGETTHLFHQLKDRFEIDFKIQEFLANMTDAQVPGKPDSTYNNIYLVL